MTNLKFSREEWETITGCDESENFTYRIFDEDEGFIEHEVNGDDAQIRLTVLENSIEASSHGFTHNMENGHGIYSQPDGWGELNEWNIEGEFFAATIQQLKESGII